ncbi:glycosyltransferase family 2 protein [Tepidanaerobacter sp. EBM-38]|uniref:glycosyltransferase family 2 protein n=1 Tax=Tepidanaerobacter sp. EBM-38 TaxID=1918496 RepID=UPI000AA0C5AE|nr:glycosyltransferase family 2 protein [Tepidanaerobacter sp. EBM-38]
MKPVTVLIPAYNEAPRIGAVLDVVCSYPREKRIIVIDDGSVDDTYKAAQRTGVEVIRHEKNLGKGAALQTGIDYVDDSPLWLFLDADLINLKHQHMDALLLPLEENPQVGMTIGMFKSGGKKNVDLAQRYFSILNGQRGLANFFVKSLPSLSWARFGVEVFLSRLAEKNNIPVIEPALKDITHYTKEEKYGFKRGFMYRLQMYKECLYALFNWQKHVPTHDKSIKNLSKDISHYE